MKVSVIIPVLNERECLPGTIAALSAHAWIHEIIVVDGGSGDGTREWLATESGVCVIDSYPGKGPQLNSGAAVASGSVLLFLHADTRLPVDAGQCLETALKDDAVVGGCFCVRFLESRPWTLRWVAAGINLRSRWRRSGTGDQAIFIRRATFQELGGCCNWPLFEDVDLVDRMKQQGEFVAMHSKLLVSARRYLMFGVLRTVLLIYALRVGFWLGASPLTLKRWFDDLRPHLVSDQPQVALPRGDIPIATIATGSRRMRRSLRR